MLGDSGQGALEEAILSWDLANMRYAVWGLLEGHAKGHMVSYSNP